MSAPGSFPVRFAGTERRLTWQWERMHWPHQLTPLSESVSREVFIAGRAAASELTGSPFRVRGRCFNGYWYEALELVVTPAEAPRLNALREDWLLKQGQSIGRRWREELLPEIEAALGRLEGLGSPALSWDGLLSDLEAALAEVRELWRIHFTIAGQWFAPVLAFENLHSELFPDAPPLTAQRLLQGHGNLTVQIDIRLRRLAHGIARGLAAALLRTPPGGEIELLEASPEGRSVLGRLRRHLHRHGRRGDLIDVHDPGWIEQPGPVFASLRQFLSHPEVDPAATMRRLAAERERLLVGVRRRLAGYPRRVRELFEARLEEARDGLLVSEDHNFYIDYRATWELRRVLLQVGWQLARSGSLDDAEDLFMLTLDELRSVRPGKRLQGRVRARMRLRDRFSGINPPESVGAPPATPPPGPGSVMSNLGAAFFGAGREVPPDALVAGSGGSPGRVIGAARLVATLADGARLRRGEILVAQSPAPTWGHLLTIAGGMVTDSGGPLAHCAVVARECGIPAVVGTVNGTRMIRDGQLLEVDGTAGIVKGLD